VFPSLGRDINLSESEAEQDGTHNVLELPQAYAGRGNMKAQQSAVRLTEVRDAGAAAVAVVPGTRRSLTPALRVPADRTPHDSAAGQGGGGPGAGQRALPRLR